MQIEIPNKDQYDQDDVFDDRYDVRNCNLNDDDPIIDLIGSIHVSVIRFNPSCDCEIKVPRFHKALCSQISRMKAQKYERTSYLS